jgi:L-amino acid N-acyltransferase YncA
LTETFLVRPAELGDISAITSIYADAVIHGTASFELEPPDDGEMARRMNALAQEGFPYLVAAGDLGVLAYAYASPYRPRMAYRHTVEDSIYVADSVRREGLGRRLLAALIDECDARGFRQMIAVIGDSASVASIRLHEALGFRHAGTLQAVGFKHGRWLDSVLMQRALGQGDSVAPAGR